MKLFAQIFKVNAETGEVHGRITEEVPDSSGEILDYASSKPNFEEWSKTASEATGGLSKGNVRAMHGKVAAGKLTEISFLDEAKAIDVVAKIVDPQEREKCIEGVYTGFSIGGKYAKRWEDGDHWRYTAQPSEVSLVDNPCLKSARFTLVKADGSQEEKPLVGKVAAREDVKPEEGKQKYGDVKFADEKNKKYPIDTEAHIRAAWNYINKPKNAGKYSVDDLKTIKGNIVAAWKATIDKEGPPSASDKAVVDGDLKKYAGEEIQDVSTAIYALSNIAYLYAKEMSEGDADQAAALKAVIENLKNFIASEIMESDDGEVMLMAAKNELKKAGARHSQGDMSKIQTIHDHAAALGADCSGTKEAAEMAELKKLEDLEARLVKVEEANQDLLAKNEALTKELEEIKANTPKPGGPALKVVGKGEDLPAGQTPKIDDKPILKADGTVDKEATALKLTKAAMGQPIALPVRQ